MKTAETYDREYKMHDTFKVIANPHHRWNLFLLTPAGNSIALKGINENGKFGIKEFANLAAIRAFLQGVSDNNQARYEANLLAELLAA